MKRTIGGRKYLMRDQRRTAEILKLYEEYCKKYGARPPLHRWLVERGKVYKEIKEASK